MIYSLLVWSIKSNHYRRVFHRFPVVLLYLLSYLLPHIAPNSVLDPRMAILSEIAVRRMRAM